MQGKHKRNTKEKKIIGCDIKEGTHIILRQICFLNKMQHCTIKVRVNYFNILVVLNIDDFA